MYGWETFLNEKYGPPQNPRDNLNRIRLSDTWFVFESLKTLQEFELELTDTTGNVHNLIERAARHYMTHGLPSDTHLGTTGCGKYLVVDGHQKVARPICAATFKPCNKTLLGNMLVHCTNTPTPGNFFIHYFIIDNKY